MTNRPYSDVKHMSDQILHQIGGLISSITVTCMTESGENSTYSIGNDQEIVKCIATENKST